jgi:hypothetical protein
MNSEKLNNMSPNTLKKQNAILKRFENINE